MCEESIAEIVEDIEVVIGGVVELADGPMKDRTPSLLRSKPKAISVVGVWISGRELNG